MRKTELYAQSGVAMTCRAFSEYEDMFMLDHNLLSKGPILDVAAGAASFTSELKQNGYDATAVDPLYKLSSEDIKSLGYKEIQVASQKLAENENLFVWDSYESLRHHDEIRVQSLNTFIDSYEKDRNKETYIAAELPMLPFENETFSLVLCNHFLFLYQAQFDQHFHQKAIAELMRITEKGGSIRIYPLVGFKDEVYPYLNELLEVAHTRGTAELIETKFRFMPSATHFLQINMK